MADVVVAFRISKPLTGRGTEMTINHALYGKYVHVPLVHTTDFIVYQGIKPVLLLWDITEENCADYLEHTIKFLKKYKPNKIMVTGPTKQTYDCETIVKNLLVQSIKTIE